jgi:hypothetical protein
MFVMRRLEKKAKPLYLFIEPFPEYMVKRQSIYLLEEKWV